MSAQNDKTSAFDGLEIDGTDAADLIVGSLRNDRLAGNDGDDLMLGLFGDDTMSGGLGADLLAGGYGHDRLIGNKGDDLMSGGAGDDSLIWNNGDGSDLMHGGAGDDRVQVNFDTDLVDDDLQNDDVAAFSSTDEGVQFARTELNGQTERGLFQLDIRETEALETNFGGGTDRAVIAGDVLDRIVLDLDGGDGIDTLDLSQAAAGVRVNLATGQLDGSSIAGFEAVVGSGFDDDLVGDGGANAISGLDGADRIAGRGGDDTLVGGKGGDQVFGGAGNDLLVWNNGDGSDLMHGGAGYDRVQVNFDTDLVDDDLQNKDVAEFSVQGPHVRFARIEVNDQTERGLFQLDIRHTEALETKFGDGDDTAVIADDVLDRIVLDLDGGDGIDTLDLGQAASGVEVDLAAGTVGASDAVGFETVTGTAFDDRITGDDGDNVIRGGAGDDVMRGGAGADAFLFFEADTGLDVILDFEFGVDQLIFATTNPDVTPEALLANVVQVGDDVELALADKTITFEDAQAADFTADAFLLA